MGMGRSTSNGTPPHTGSLRNPPVLIRHGLQRRALPSRKGPLQRQWAARIVRAKGCDLVACVRLQRVHRRCIVVICIITRVCDPHRRAVARPHGRTSSQSRVGAVGCGDQRRGGRTACQDTGAMLFFTCYIGTSRKKGDTHDCRDEPHFCCS